MIRMSSMPALTASSTIYWMAGLSTRGSISLGTVLLAGSIRVPQPAAGITALRTFIGSTSSWALSLWLFDSISHSPEKGKWSGPIFTKASNLHKENFTGGKFFYNRYDFRSISHFRLAFPTSPLYNIYHLFGGEVSAGKREKECQSWIPKFCPLSRWPVCSCSW